MTNITCVLSTVYGNYEIHESENSSLLIAKGKVVLPESNSHKEMKVADNSSSYLGSLLAESNYQKTESGILLFK